MSYGGLVNFHLGGRKNSHDENDCYNRDKAKNTAITLYYSRIDVIVTIIIIIITI